MEDLFFLVEESDEGGYIGKGMDVAIVSESETIEGLKAAIKDAVHCHYENEIEPGVTILFA